jgi:putative spermidine/putrescine transport system substrate-binding protein
MIVDGGRRDLLRSGFPYGFTNQKAAEYIPADVMRELPTSPENFKKLIVQDAEWWATNREAVIARWNKWVLS